ESATRRGRRSRIGQPLGRPFQWRRRHWRYAKGIRGSSLWRRRRQSSRATLRLTSSLVDSFRRASGSRLVDLGFHGRQVEAGALLHRWEVDGRLGELGHFFLHEYEAPELVGEPVVVGERPAGGGRQAGALERVEAEVGQNRPVDLDRR